MPILFTWIIGEIIIYFIDYLKIRRNHEYFSFKGGSKIYYLKVIEQDSTSLYVESTEKLYVSYDGLTNKFWIDRLNSNLCRITEEEYIASLIINN